MMHSKILCVLLLCAFVQATNNLLDDFHNQDYNHIGGKRTGANTQNLNFPTDQVQIKHANEFLMESLTSTSYHRQNLARKSLKVHYSCWTSGDRTLKYVQLGPNLDEAYSKTFFTETYFAAGTHESIIIPFSRFTSADLTIGYAIGIGGPLIVHKLELVAIAESATTSIILPPQRRERLLMNLNSLLLKRYGKNVLKQLDGVQISDSGYINEDLVAGSKILDLRQYKAFRITYSAQDAGYLKVQLRPHEHLMEASHILTRPKIVKGNKKHVDVPLSAFENLDPISIKCIRILGPAMVHKIDLVLPHSKGLLSNFMHHDKELKLVDDLATWPDPALLAQMEPHTRRSEQPNRAVTPIRANQAPRTVLLNNLQCPCFGVGTQTLPTGGILISHHGTLSESIAKHNQYYDLTGAFIEFKYASESLVERNLEVGVVVPNIQGTEYRADTKLVEVMFPPTQLGKRQFSLQQFGLATRIRLAGVGKITLYRIRILLPRMQGSRPFTPDLVDDFTNWRGPSTSSSQPPPPQQTVQTHPLHFTDPSPSQLPALALNVPHFLVNSLNLPCRGTATIALGTGIRISIAGFITQTLAPTGLPLDSTNALIEFKYTVEQTIVRQIQVQMSDGCSKFLNAEFPAGENVYTSLPLLDCGPITGFRLIGHGELTLFKILIHLQLENRQIETRIVDDFANWQQHQSPTAVSQLPQQTQYRPAPPQTRPVLPTHRQLHFMHAPTIFNYRQQNAYPAPGLHRSAFVSGVGIQIQPNGILCQVLPRSVGKYLVINYSLGSAGTRQIKFSTLLELGDAINEQSVMLTFHAGSHQEVFVELPVVSANNSPVTVSSVRILGPLMVHHLQLTNTRPLRSVHSLHSSLLRPMHALHAGPSNYQHSEPGTYKYKLQTFKQDLKTLYPPHGTFELHVRRTHVWQDVYADILQDSGKLHRPLKVSFVNEPGHDRGGLTRELFTILASVINNPDYALFTASADANYALQINPNSMFQSKHHLEHFRVIGRIIGLAILNNNVLGIRLVPCLYQKMLTKQSPDESSDLPVLKEKDDDGDVDISALQPIDNDLYERFTNLLKQKDISAFGELTFTMEWPMMGKHVTIDLVKNGSQHLLTNANKKQYVVEYAKWRSGKMVEPQANALRDGVWDVIPQNLLARFTVSELENLIGGQVELDLNDWKTHTAFKYHYSETHPAIKLFWKCVESWDNATRSKLLQFVTGSPRLPSTGFSGLANRFTITKIPDTTQLPTAATCFNELKLPPYATLQSMCARLKTASFEVESFELQ